MRLLINTVIYTALLITFLLLIYTVFDLKGKHSNLYVLMAIAVIMGISNLITTKQLLEVSFDTDKKVIRFQYQTLITGQKTKALAFENARLEFHTPALSRFKIGEPIKLYFLQSKTVFFEASPGKDGFSIEALEKIGTQAESLSIPTLRK